MARKIKSKTILRKGKKIRSKKADEASLSRLFQVISDAAKYSIGIKNGIENLRQKFNRR